MLPFRRSARTIQSRKNLASVVRICFAKVPAFYSDNGGVDQESSCFASGSTSSYSTASNGFSTSSTSSSLSMSFSVHRGLSSQAVEKSSGSENELQDGFSELEEEPVEPVKADVTDGNEEDENDLSSEEEHGLSEHDDDGREDILMATSKTNLNGKLFYVLLNAPQNNVTSALDKYVSEGNVIERSNAAIALAKFRKRRLFGKALQLVEWLEANKSYDFTERDYGSHLDLIAKAHGVYAAEKYIQKIPESFRGEIVYRSLLANWVFSGNVKKSEQVFNKIRDLGLPLTSIACNHLLVLYKRVDVKKIGDVLVMMEKENIKPTPFTYRLLIDVKGRANDIKGMEDILETMKAEGVETSNEVLATLAKYYIRAGLTEKAESLLKEIEDDNLSDHPRCCNLLISLYASSGKADDVERVWEICKENPSADEYLVTIDAWGKLGKIEKAEEVFESVVKRWRKFSPRYYGALLRVYAQHKLLAKGKELVKRMSNSGSTIHPELWDPLVRLYVEAGEVEKADSILHKLITKNNQMKAKPWYATYMVLLCNYAKRGDIHNAEKIFHEMRMNGHTGRLNVYKSLLDAYIIAKTPAYGFRERMKADNFFPNYSLTSQLNILDKFKKNYDVEFLD